MIASHEVHNKPQTTQAALPFDKTATTFTQSLNGFIEAQSSNTLRNSVAPISFPKAKRFNNPIPPGASVPFYNTARKFDKKKGTGFGYGKKLGPVMKSYSPGPGRYDDPSLLSLARLKDSKFKNAKFGGGYDRFKMTCDIPIGIKIYDDRDKPCPNFYKAKKYPQYSMGKKLPGMIEILEKSAELPSPFHYKIKTEYVLPSRHKNVGFGYGEKSNKKDKELSPGPGDYNLNSFTDKFKPSIYSIVRKKQKGGLSRSIQPTPRDCSLAKPLSGGVFDPMGVVTKKGTVGFNYPPLKQPGYFKSANMMFYKTDGFNNNQKKFGASKRMLEVHKGSNSKSIMESNAQSVKNSISD
ncbi:unnamed protein product [Moneuplotes crassus]|uniref:Uncharacterized protein n=1 Tax=Euplotes crassus TaxID=5936 RepID=A0AAD1UF91_EUPCR|nr:unnamed protein product [Moneuplotes crassus]